MQIPSLPSLPATVLAITFAGTVTAGPGERFADVTVTAQHVGGSVHMLIGAGGNVGVSVGPDGTLLVDDDYAELGQRLSEAVNELGGDQPKLVLNTHYHGDHVGSNPTFGGPGTIIAHDNVRIRLLDEDLPRAALPIVTFSDRLRIHFNDDEIDVIHLPNGHTDGDSIVWFRNAGVAHLGDHFFNGRFPYVDVDAGGRVDGLVENLETVLALLPADTRIIPGHGALSNMVELAEAVAMIRESKALVMARLAAGETIEQIAESGLGEDWERYEWTIDSGRWARIVHASEAAETNPSSGTSRR